MVTRLASVGCGWPIWHTRGEGGDVPAKVKHDFRYDPLQHGARIDMSRGNSTEDKSNKGWSEGWLAYLPRYRGTVGQSPYNQASQGNAMEQAAGVAYAAATDSEYLLDGELDWTRHYVTRRQG